MKILALGGAGAVGRATLAHVCGFAEVESVTIADIDAKGAAAAASVLGDKAQPLTLDILDARAMDRALAPADLVLNTSGPYFRFGLPAFHAALEAGRAYFDVCDDPEPTLGMLTADHRARKAGVGALIGMGARPGITNLLAVKAHQALDQVESLVTGFDAGEELRALGAGAAAPRAPHWHWVQQTSGSVSVYRRGERELAQALEAVRCAVPGHGARTLHRLGQPEAVTLGRYYRDLADAPALMAVDRGAQRRLASLAGALAQQRLDIDQAARQLAKNTSEAGGLASRLQGLLSGGRGTRLPRLFACARGRLAGKPATAMASISRLPAQPIAVIAGTALAIGLRLWLDARLELSGVTCPEAAVDADFFFAEWAGRCPGLGSGNDDAAVHLQVT